MTVELMNVIGQDGVNFGHPGVMYNVVDEKNFDFVYFRFVVYEKPGKPGILPLLSIYTTKGGVRSSTNGDLFCDLTANSV